MVTHSATAELRRSDNYITITERKCSK